MKNCKIILASRSPRRREILGAIFNNFSTLDIDFDPEPNPFRNEKPVHFVRRCLEHKVSLLLEKLKQGQVPETGPQPFGQPSRCTLIILADTSVVTEKEILGKPNNPREAGDMLARLSGNTHRVLTGVGLCQWQSNRPLSPRIFIESSEVRFRPLSRSEIHRYVRSGEPLDKAGAYGFQGLGHALIEEVHGSYSNVIGLPLQRLQRELKKIL